MQVLVGFGNIIGRGPGWRVEGDFHATNEYVVIVGDTAKARKGVSFKRVRQLLERVDDTWARERIANGLSSGEGVVWHVRDATTKRRKAKRNEVLRRDVDDDGYVVEVDDPGVTDKRLLVQEGEFAQALKVMSREGNTLSPALRVLWDRGDHGTLTKNSPVRTTGALVSIIGHITADELRFGLTESERANGFANRFLFVCARRSKSLPFGGDPENRFAGPLRPSVRGGGPPRRDHRDADDGGATRRGYGAPSTRSCRRAGPAYGARSRRGRKRTSSASRSSTRYWTSPPKSARTTCAPRSPCGAIARIPPRTCSAGAREATSRTACCP